MSCHQDDLDEHMYLSNPLSDTKGVKKTVLPVNMNSVQAIYN